MTSLSIAYRFAALVIALTHWPGELGVYVAVSVALTAFDWLLFLAVAVDTCVLLCGGVSPETASKLAASGVEANARVLHAVLLVTALTYTKALIEAPRILVVLFVVEMLTHARALVFGPTTAPLWSALRQVPTGPDTV